MGEAVTETTSEAVMEAMVERAAQNLPSVPIGRQIVERAFNDAGVPALIAALREIANRRKFPYYNDPEAIAQEVLRQMEAPDHDLNVIAAGGGVVELYCDNCGAFIGVEGQYLTHINADCIRELHRRLAALEAPE